MSRNLLVLACLGFAFSPEARAQTQVVHPAPIDSGFGESMDIDGETIVVGAPGDPGLVHVFERGQGTWAQSALLRPTVWDSGDGYAEKVAIDGDRLLVGVARDDAANSDPSNNGLQDSGAVYVYRRQGGEWVQEAFLKSPSPVAGARFGAELVLDGNLAVIAEADSTSMTANVFERQGTSWMLIDRFSVPISHGVGLALDLDGGTLVIGRPAFWVPGGTVFIYELNAGQFQLVTQFHSPTQMDSGFFGMSVDLRGDELFVAAAAEHVVYRYERVAGSWSSAQVAVTGPPGSVRFGQSIAATPDQLVVLDHLSGTPDGNLEGQVFFSARNGASYGPLIPHDSSPGDLRYMGAVVVAEPGIVATLQSEHALVIYESTECVVPQSFCTATVNSTGLAAAMESVGTASISSNSLSLVARDLPAQTFGVFLMGMEPQVADPMGLCLHGEVIRVGLVSSDPSGVAQLDMDLTQPVGTTELEIGYRRYFQFWYRDVAGGPPGYNFSDGLTVTFCP